MQRLIIKCLANILGFYLASRLFPQIYVSSVEIVFWAGFVLGLLNLFIRPLLLLISLPVNLLTLGLFTLIINTWLVMLTAYLVEGISIPTFLLAFAAAFVVSATNFIVDKLICK